MYQRSNYKWWWNMMRWKWMRRNNIFLCYKTIIPYYYECNFRKWNTNVCCSANMAELELIFSMLLFM